MRRVVLVLLYGVGALSLLGSIVLAGVGLHGPGLAISTLELIGALAGISAMSWCLVLQARAGDDLPKRILSCRVQACAGLGFIGAGALMLIGHAYWQAIGVTQADVYEAAETLAAELVVSNAQQGIATIYVEINGHPLRPELVASLRERMPGVSVRPASDLTPAQRVRGVVDGGSRNDLIDIRGFSYPAWRVVEIKYCGGAGVDYFYYHKHWIRMGATLSGGCI